MGFPTKVQLIKRKASEQWYINFPSAVAQAMDFSRGETVEWSIEDKSLLALRRLNPPASVLKKTLPASSPPSSNSGDECLPAFSQHRVAERAQALSLSSLLCLGRHTVTGLLTTCGQEFLDWSADYRLFSHHRLPLPADLLRHPPRRAGQLPSAGSPLCRHRRYPAAQDRHSHSRCRLAPRSARPPLPNQLRARSTRSCNSPPISLFPDGNHRMVPIAFLHAPTPAKPSSKASEEQRPPTAKPARQARLSLRASQQIAALRQALDADAGGAARRLYVFGDGGYTNSTVLKNSSAQYRFDWPHPQRRQTVLSAARTPAPSHAWPPRRYGAPAPTPEAVRTDESVPWQTISISHLPAPLIR